MSATSNVFNTRISRLMAERFSLEEIDAACFDLGINSQEIPGKTLSEKIRELIIYTDNRGRLPDLLAYIQAERPNQPWPIPADDNDAHPPFKGLQFFNEEDETVFFGREALTGELVSHLSQHRFLAVIGPSGSGKSSVVHAGLIPSIRQGKAEYQGQKSDQWSVHIITPGDKPLTELANTLTKNVEGLTAAKTLLKDFCTDTESLDLWLRRNVDRQTRLLIVVDQFEELFTHCHDAEERRLFVGNLVNAVQSGKPGRLSLVLTLRSDFYDFAVEQNALVPLLETRQRIVKTMNLNELRQAIEGPLENTPWNYQPGLVETILEDIGAKEGQIPEPGALPLLSHALLETWKWREGRVLTLAGYQGAGGIRKAIAHTADDVYEQLTPDEQAIARNIFLRLTELSEDTQNTRRRTQLTELTPQTSQKEEVQKVIGQLAQARLVTISEDSAEVAHEALIREWPRLKKWLDENRKHLLVLRDLTEAAYKWERHDRLDIYLYREPHLDEALRIFPPGEIKTRYSRFLHVLKRFFYRGDSLDSERQSQSAEAYYSSGYTPSTLEKLFLSASLEAREKFWIKRGTSWLGIVLLVTLLPFLVYFLGKNLSAIDWYGGRWNAVEEFYGNEINKLLVPIDTPEIYAVVDIIAINHSKILKSQDEGETWNDFDQGLPELRITGIVKIPDEENSMYASTLGAGVFTYDRSKSSWVPINEGLSNFAVRDIAYDFDDPSKLFVAAYGRYGGIYRSNNSGATWSLSNNGLTSENVLKVVVDPIDHDRVYAITEAQGIFKSEDSAETWETFNSPSENIVSFLIHPYDNSRLFVATFRKGIFKSVDSGKNWEAINSGLPNIFQSRTMAFLSTNPDQIYLGANIYGGDRLYQSKDGGENWATLPINWSGVQIRDVVDGFNNEIFIGSVSGLYHVTQQEELSSSRLPLIKFKLPGSSLAINADNSSLFMAVHGGVFRYQYSEDKWEFFDDGFTHPSIRTLVPDPFDPNRLYAGMFSDGASDVLFVTNDKGESWNSLGTFQNGLENDDVRSIVIDLNNTKVLYAGTYGSGVFKTIDHGENWVPINAGITESRIVKLVINSQNPEIIYAIGEGGPVFQTTNGGQLWQEMPETRDLDIRDLEIIPEDSQPCITIFGVFAGNIQCWTGKNWEFLGSGLDSNFVTQFEISESNPNTFFAGTNDKGIYWSRDKGESWEPINDGLGTTKIEFLLANPMAKDALYALVQNQGLFTFEPLYLWQRD